MWKREAIVACFSSPTPAQSATSSGDVDPLQKKRPLDDELLAGVGQSILISGELSGDEDLTVQGGVEGKIALRDHVLTVGSHGRINGQVTAETIVVLGHVTGNLIATEKRDIKQDKLDQLPRFLSGRFPLPDASIDAVLGWDIFDYIDPLAASALAEELIRLVRPGGVLLAFFGTVASDHPRYVKYFIEDAAHLRYRSSPAPRRRWILHNRDIRLMFAGLELCDSVLLKS